MNISTNLNAIAAKHAQSVLSNPKTRLSENQKTDVEAIVKKHETSKSEYYTKSNALTSLNSNPYNPFYGVREASDLYNYSAAEGRSKNNSVNNLHTFNSLAKLNEKLDTRQSLTMQKFQFLRSQL